MNPIEEIKQLVILELTNILRGNDPAFNALTRYTIAMALAKVADLFPTASATTTATTFHG